MYNQLKYMCRFADIALSASASALTRKNRKTKGTKTLLDSYPPTNRYRKSASRMLKMRRLYPTLDYIQHSCPPNAPIRCAGRMKTHHLACFCSIKNPTGNKSLLRRRPLRPRALLQLQRKPSSARHQAPHQRRARLHVIEVLGVDDVERLAEDGVQDRQRGSIHLQSQQLELQAVHARSADGEVGKVEEGGGQIPCRSVGRRYRLCGVVQL